jgi:hypothetical protein
MLLDAPSYVAHGWGTDPIQAGTLGFCSNNILSWLGTEIFEEIQGQDAEVLLGADADAWVTYLNKLFPRL